MAVTELDSTRYSKLVTTEIPNGRKALLDSHKNLQDLAVYCEDSFSNAPNLQEQSEAVLQSKQYAIQSLASVAYMINNMAMHTLELCNHQCIHLKNLESAIHNIRQNTDIHKEKVARREVGQVAAARYTDIRPKVILPETLDTGRKYDRVVIQDTLYDGIGCGCTKSSVKRRRAAGSVRGHSRIQEQQLVGTSENVLFVAAPTAPMAGPQRTTKLESTSEVMPPNSISTPPTTVPSVPPTPPSAATTPASSAGKDVTPLPPMTRPPPIAAREGHHRRNLSLRGSSVGPVHSLLSRQLSLDGFNPQTATSCSHPDAPLTSPPLDAPPIYSDIVKPSASSEERGQLPPPKAQSHVPPPVVPTPEDLPALLQRASLDSVNGFPTPPPISQHIMEDDYACVPQEEEEDAAYQLYSTAGDEGVYASL